MAAADMTAADATGPDLVVPKEEPLEDDFTSSSVSSPEPDGERGPTAQDAAPVQKRKGGRKPVSPLPSTSLSVLFMSTHPLGSPVPSVTSGLSWLLLLLMTMMLLVVVVRL